MNATPIPERLRAWLTHAVAAGASDLHVIAGYPPVLRLHGDLVELKEPALTGEDTHSTFSHRSWMIADYFAGVPRCQEANNRSS